MVLTEEDVGITEFLRNHEPFEAILKQYMDDFIVNEIDKEGVVVEQNSLEVPRNLAKDKDKNEKNDVNPNLLKSESKTGENPGNTKSYSAEGLVSVEITDKKIQSDVPNSAVVSAGIDSGKSDVMDENSKHVKYEDTKADVDFSELGVVFPDDWKNLLTPLKEALESESSYTFPPTPDKGTRKTLHEWVRKNLPKYHSLTITSPNEEGLQSVEIRRGKSKDYREQKSRLKQHYNSDSTYVGYRDYVQCTLWKRGKDTMDALNDIARNLRINPDSLSTAGTKDRRGVTVQRIRVKGVSLFKLANVNKQRSSFGRNRNRCVALGDFEILRGKDAKHLRLGDLQGNRFTLVLRGVREVPQNLIEDAILNLKTYGFINYYGLQRFGSGASPTHHTGFALLRGDYKEACMRILTPLTIESVGVRGSISHKRQMTEKGLKDFTNGDIDAKTLLKILPKWMHNELKLVRSFATDEKENKDHDYHKAFCKLPRNMQMMYVHAVQSYLWNCMASKRVSMFNVGDSGREYAVQGDLVPLREGTSVFNASTIVRKVTKEEEVQRSIKITEIIIPVIGRTVPVPDGDVGQAVKDIMTKEKLDLSTVFNEYDTDLKGSYRRLITVPEDIQHRFEMYEKNDNRPLVRYGIDRFDNKKRMREDEDEAKQKKIKLNNNNNVSGSSGKILVDNKEKLSEKSVIRKPDESEAMETDEDKGTNGEIADEEKESNKNERETATATSRESQDLTTDKMDVVKAGEDCENLEVGRTKTDITTDETAIEDAGSQELSLNHGIDKKNVIPLDNKSEATQDNAEEMEKALIISFSLSLAAYATMLTRELTHKQTDTAHFRKLTAYHGTGNNKDVMSQRSEQKGTKSNN